MAFRGYAEFASLSSIESVDEILPLKQICLCFLKNRDPLCPVHHAQVLLQHVGEQELMRQVFAPHQEVLDVFKYLLPCVFRFTELLREWGIQLSQAPLHAIPCMRKGMSGESCGWINRVSRVIASSNC